MTESVVTELEQTFTTQRLSSVCEAACVTFPAIRHSRKRFLSGQCMHDSQLDTVQAMIKRTRNHGQQSSGLFVQRPEAQVVTIDVGKESVDGMVEEVLRSLAPCGEEIVVNTPRSPDETVQNVGRRRDYVLLKPDIATFVGEGHSTLVSGLEEALESTGGLFQVCTVASFTMGSNQQRDTLPLRQC